ncbi:hypothetical protein GKE82_18720 [Conexibacter sp. W3-3-2]|uniref:hypothetical protein n=1 Tax=Conexibacter sp. W3-3-2 TaxID=2675227 RepID=UPI0012B8E05C|nr:hypothetical protein [Conexibacter sp. W3-3-2]MTD46262.1 hypothetical protein [Conexibacter sp. W3-3-2]
MTRRCLAALVAVAALAPATSAPAATHRTWHVDADAARPGDGTAARPFATLAAVEAASRPGDRIVVGPSLTALDGGLRLQRGQRVQGLGDPHGGPGVPAARITNTAAARLDGDAVRLADQTAVRGLRIEAPRRGGIYGLDVARATVTGNDVSGHNVSCTRGFLIPPFAVPTTVPGVGVPIRDGLHNGWAAIMVDAARGTTNVTVDRNRVHDADCGDGIDVRISGDALGRVRIRGNDVRELREGPDFESVLAIGLQTRDRARLVAVLDDNRQRGLGNDEDLGVGPTGADSEGVFVNPVGASRLRATITRNDYRHTPGRGGFSANGLEVVAMGEGSRGLVTVRDSHFSGTPGDVLELLALGTGARLALRLERVSATGSTGFAGSGFGDTVAIPGNNGDCLIAASGGARNAIDLRVRDSVLRGCANNGLTFGAAVANGRGPSASLDGEITGTTIRANRGAGLRVGNVAGLDRLALKVQDSDLSGNRGATSSPANVVAEDLGTTGRATIDLGGGPLGSTGGVCLGGGPLDVALVRYDVHLRHAWWGRRGGPAPGRTLAVGGRLDARQPLDAAPAHCGRDAPLSGRAAPSR